MKHKKSLTSMKHERFFKAVHKLRKAFQERKLDPNNCEACAVGNMLGHGIWDSNYTGFENGFEPEIALTHLHHQDWPSLHSVGSYINNDTGYSDIELALVEAVFMSTFDRMVPVVDLYAYDEVGDFNPMNEEDESLHYVYEKALENVITFLHGLEDWEEEVKALVEQAIPGCMQLNSQMEQLEKQY